MGYRSDVAIAFNYKYVTDEVLTKLIELHDHIQYMEDEGDHYLLVIIEGVKWIPNNECGIIINWLTTLNEEEYCIVELGEDSSDNQIGGSLRVFDLSYIRQITYSYGEEYSKEEDFDTLKVDMSIPSKETIFSKIRDIHVHSLKEQSE